MADDEYEGEPTAEEELDEIMAERYWIAKKPEDFASDATDRFESHYQSYLTSGIGRTIARSYRMYHSMKVDGVSDGHSAPLHAPSFIGEQGEFVYTEVSHYRNSILHQKSLVMSERPAFIVHASTAEADSIEQVEMAESVLDYAMETRGVGDVLDAAVETALVESIGWVRLDWDTFDQDLTCHSLGVFDVAHQRCRRIEDAEWLVARVTESRWRLVAEARASGDSELALAIAAADNALDEDEKSAFPQATAVDGTADDEKDVVFVLHVYCRPTPQMPEGRYARILDDIVIEDGPFRFKEIPVYPIAPNTFVGSTVPYSNSWDIMPLQSLSNATLSAMASRIDAFGVPNIAYQEGTEIGVHENGLALWSMRAGEMKPEVLDFLGNFPSALPQFHGLMEQLQSKISGVNDVVRGQPNENITSGSMAALFEAQAVKFNSPTERALVYASERIGLGIVRMYQGFAQEDMIISITGSDDKSVVKTFSRGSLEKISRVSVQRTNPVTKTNAGRMEIANQLLQMGHLKSSTEYMSAAKTGNITPLFTDDTTLAAHIKDENTRMLNGEPIEAADFENHMVHIKEHLAKFDARTRTNNPQAAMLLEQHIRDHFKRWQQISIVSPGLLVPHGIPGLPLGMAAQQMAAQSGAQPQPEGGPSAGPSKGKPGPAAKPPGSKPENGPRLPSMPKPATPKDNK